MIDWLFNNKEWFFSGAGVTLFVGAYAIFRSIYKKSRADTPPIVVRVETSPTTANHPDLPTTATVGPVERISQITASEIQKSIKIAPPLQRKAVAERYKGLRIEWDAEFRSAHERDGVVSVLLRTEWRDPMPAPFYVNCDVNFAEYRELAILPEGARVRITGTIDEVGDSIVDLKDPRITFLYS